MPLTVPYRLLPFLLAFACLPPASRAQDPYVDGTMPEDYLPGLKGILNTALKQSPEMIRNEILVAQGQANVYSSDHQLWPNLGGGASYLENKSSTAGGAGTTASGLIYNIGLSQPVFQWGAYVNQSKIGRINLLMDERQYAEAYRNLAIAIREQYEGLILKELNVRNARFSAKLSQGALDIVEQRLKNGAISAAEVQEPQLELEEANLGVDRAEEDLESSKRMFCHLAGLKAISDSEIPMDIPKAAYKPDAAAVLLAGLLRDHADNTFLAQVYEMDIQQADLNYKIAKVQLLPKFFVGTSYSVQNETTAVNTTIYSSVINQLNVNVNAQWTIFDGFATRGAKLSALATKRLDQRLLQTYVESTEDQAQHLSRLLEISARYQELMDKRWHQQDAALGEATKEFKLGVQPQSIVDSNTAGRYAADVNNAGARADFLSQWNEFVSLVGRDPALNNLPPRYVRENP